MLMAHYMPWYATKEVSGHWGWHWTMNKFDPDKRLPDGSREAASHDRPLIGLYDSGDIHALECHVQLMKLAGIDGVIVDWYGIKEFNDYGVIHRNTRRLFEVIKRAKLKFAVCYEDQSIKHMAAGGALKAEEATAHGKEVFAWMEKNWFRDESYLKIDGRPLLLVFGPQYFNPPDWEALLSTPASRPRLHVLPHGRSKAGTEGRFGWPPVTGGKEIPRATWRAYLDRLYAGDDVADSVVGVAFPGFRDIYGEAGLHETYGFIPEFGGQTFTETLDRALASGTKVVQLVTWNDYGEGTVIEPTRRREFEFLQEVQKRRQPTGVGEIAVVAADLRLPIELYQLRKNKAGNRDAETLLDRAADALLAGDCALARKLLKMTPH